MKLPAQSINALLQLGLIPMALSYSIPNKVDQDLNNSNIGDIKTILDRVIAAMGGSAALEALHTVSY